MLLSYNKYNSNYRKSVGIMLLNKENKIFIAKRIDSSTYNWQMPQGGINKNESPLNAALRELKEEIGTNNVKVIIEFREWINYNLPIVLTKKVWNGKYKGQHQKWFAMKFLGKTKDINLNTKTQEFTHWKWVNVNKILRNVIPFKKAIYSTLIKKIFPKIKLL